MICAGIDAGSRTLKIVLLDAERRTPLAARVVDQGIDQDRLAAELLDRLLEEHGLRRDALGGIVATGYGRKLVGATPDRGDRDHLPGLGRPPWRARTRGPSSTSAARTANWSGSTPNGTVADFVMNDRCAAGSGRFLEMLAAQLGTKFSELESLVRRSRNPATISSMCVVFAETEIVGLLASGVPPEDILTGVETAIATRIAAMAGHDAGGADRVYRRRGLGAGNGRGTGRGVGAPGANRPAAAMHLRAWAPRCWRPTGSAACRRRIREWTVACTMVVHGVR